MGGTDVRGTGVRQRRSISVGIVVLFVALGAASCGSSSITDLEGTPPAGTQPDFYFVGNSLTYTNDLPAVVAALAAELGQPITYITEAHPNWSLEEHWAFDIAGQIRQHRPKAVVMQQGPSTVMESRTHLVAWSKRIGDVVHEVGGEVALLGVAPPNSRIEYLEAGATSYAEAARGTNGYYIPASETWREAWELDSTLPLYGPDGFHPSYLGTLAAAHTILAVLMDVNPDSIPSIPDGVSPEHLTVLRQAVKESTRAAFGPQP